MSKCGDHYVFARGFLRQTYSVTCVTTSLTSIEISNSNSIHSAGGKMSECLRRKRKDFWTQIHMHNLTFYMLTVLPMYKEVEMKCLILRTVLF